MKIEGIDYIELYVANLPQAVHFYKSTFHLIPVAYSNQPDYSSILLQQGNIRIILTSSSDPDSEVSKHIHLHGDGVKDIAFHTSNVTALYENAIKKQVRIIMQPIAIDDNGLQIRKAVLGTFGDTIHSLIERDINAPYFLPHFKPLAQQENLQRHSNLTAVDHVAICVEQGSLDDWVAYYQEIYNLQQTYEEYVTTANSGMNSKVVESKDNKIKLVLVAPTIGKYRSQVAEYLRHYKTPGVQHLAFLTDDIVAAVTTLQNAGMNFLAIPESYYEIQKTKLNLDENNFQILKERAILVDKDDIGYLFQIFTKPVATRPTLFYEIIQRKGSIGFGSGNIKALFQAIEQTQLKCESNEC